MIVRACTYLECVYEFNWNKITYKFMGLDRDCQFLSYNDNIFYIFNYKI